jgi:hypothetical protein
MWNQAFWIVFALCLLLIGIGIGETGCGDTVACINAAMELR